MRRLLVLASLLAASVLPCVAEAAPLYDVGPGGLAQAAQSSDALTEATVPVPNESHLPAWVQVVTTSGSLSATDADGGPTLAALPRFTFLRVLAGGASRLQVQTYDPNGAPVQTGWVSADQVLPSAAGNAWLVTSAPTALYSAADASGAAVRNLDRFTPLQGVDNALGDRLLVRVYRSDFSGVVDQGWVDASAVGPAYPPQVRVPSPTQTAVGLRSPSSSSLQQAFLDAAAQAARQGQTLTGVPASVTVAQAILESDWGRSALSVQANNFFGIKAMGTLGNDGVVWMSTAEYDDDGQLYQTTSAFRAYKSLLDSVADHDRLLATASRYAGAMQARSNPQRFASLLAEEGYSTDPAYADKLVALMDRYNLYQLDS